MINAEINELKKNSLFLSSFNRKIELQCKNNHGPTELDDTLRIFEELSVSIVDLTHYFFSERNLKTAYISSFICMFSN
jgi:hypothetical protein